MENSFDWTAEVGKPSPVPSDGGKCPGEVCGIVKNGKQISKIQCLECNAVCLFACLFIFKGECLVTNKDGRKETSC